MLRQLEKGIEIRAELKPEYIKILTPEAVAFLAKLHRSFDPRRIALLQQRAERQHRLNEGEKPCFLEATKSIREDSSWRVAETPGCLQKRWVEITGPTDRKMMINAMNSGADVYMADFEDANTPTWSNLLEGQINIRDTVNGTISYESPDGKHYRLEGAQATLFVRPRGWHLNEKHLLVDGAEISGSLFDFGLYLFHNAKSLMAKGKGPYFYLPKLESHHESKLWNDVFVLAQQELGIPRGTIRATVLVETILAVFEMEEILFQLKEHSGGLNAGRWDYIFSIIKKFQRDPKLTLPDRDQITMTVPFMRAYTDLLVRTCHKRGAHAIGGMAAFVPNRKDPEVTERALAKVREDKLREVGDGFDGTWVAHPDLVSIAKEVFEANLREKANQKERLREDVRVSPDQLLNFQVPNGKVTEEGLRHNLNVALQYLAAWLSGKGAVTIFNLMEDTATAEISRAQVWQWRHSKARLASGAEITQDLIEKLLNEEIANIAKLYGKQFDSKLFESARGLFHHLVLSSQFVDFLTLPAYKLID